MLEDELLRRVAHTVAEERLFERGERIVAAVSGGPDSIALLHLLRGLRERFDWELSAAHINHALRGEESEEEEAYVRSFCEWIDVPCYVTRVDVRGNMPKYGNNLQATARALRFQAFRETSSMLHTDTVALAHHGDDQAETVLMRLLRGTGPGGLAGIRYKTVVDGMKLVRPLLRITKAELEAYCERHDLRPRFDSSNASRHYFRNVIRLDILPYIMKLREGAADSLRRVAEMSADEDDYMDEAARQKLAGTVAWTDGTAQADLETFRSAHIALQRRMIKIILSSLNLDEESIDFDKIERIREAIAANRPTTIELRIGKDAMFRRSYETLEWGPYEPENPQPYSYRINVSQAGVLELPGIGARLMWQVKPNEGRVPAADNESTAWFDADAAKGAWIVRARKPGDRIAAFGLNGTRRVKDIFVDAKLPKRRREEWPIVTDGNGEVVWVPGFRRSNAAPVRDDTRHVLEMRLELRDPDRG